MIPRSFGTHDGSFHADEVSACALLLVFDQIDRDKIRRNRNPAVLAECEFVCDVGGVYDPKIKRFDHHQLTYTGSLASAGMIWQYLRDEGVVDPHLYDFINSRVVIGVDAHDNGIQLEEEGVCTFSHIIANYVPLSHSASREELDAAFFKALEFATGYYERLVKRYQFIQACRGKVAEAMAKEGDILLFNESIPWQDSFFELGGENHSAHFIIMPSGEHWKLRGIPPHPSRMMEVRIPLPEQWAGLRDEELQAVTGIKGAIFCHKGRFISIWETKADALKAYDLVKRETEGA